MKGHGSYTSFSYLFLQKVWKTGFSSFLTSAGPYPALPRAPVLWSGLLQGWGYAQGHIHGLGKKSLVLNVFLGTVVSIAESEKILYTPKAKTWLTRPVLSNLSNLNYYSLKLKVFKWVVVNDPSRSLGQHVTCRACSPSIQVWWLKTEARTSAWSALVDLTQRGSAHRAAPHNHQDQPWVHSTHFKPHASAGPVAFTTLLKIQSSSRTNLS